MTRRYPSMSDLKEKCRINKIRLHRIEAVTGIPGSTVWNYLNGESRPPSGFEDIVEKMIREKEQKEKK